MICNTGVGLTPRLDGEVLHFQEQGLYDGLFLMADTETGTYWSHLTGEALHGPLAGERIPVENVMHTTVEQALEEDAGTLIALSDTFRGRRVLVYDDPTAHSLQALYTDARSARWEGDVLLLSNGRRIEDGVLVKEDSRRVGMERPQQVFTRWYGFSLRFPETEIWEEG